MTAEYACTRKQFNRNLSEFGLIQVLMVVHWYICQFHCVSIICVLGVSVLMIPMQ